MLAPKSTIECECQKLRLAFSSRTHAPQTIPSLAYTKPMCLNARCTFNILKVIWSNFQFWANHSIILNTVERVWSELRTLDHPFPSIWNSEMLNLDYAQLEADRFTADIFTSTVFDIYEWQVVRVCESFHLTSGKFYRTFVECLRDRTRCHSKTMPITMLPVNNNILCFLWPMDGWEK